MAVSSHASTALSQTPLLENIVEGAVDYKGQRVGRSNSGGWSAAALIIGVEVSERFAYYGISSNLITYLTGPLGQSTAKAAENVNVWSGTALMLPLLGALVADSFLGRYRTIVVASVLYIVGLSLMILSAILPSTSCQTNKILSCSTEIQEILFFFSLYLVALAQGGHRPCVQALGADQFDEKDAEESKTKSSFFNWWNFGICVGSLVSYLILNYIQDNLSWVLGFGVPCIAMLLAFVVFLLGTKTYRYSMMPRKRSPFARIGRVFVAAFKNRRSNPATITIEEEYGTPSYQSFEQFKFLNKALHAADEPLISINEVEEAKTVLRLVPIWGSCMAVSIAIAQLSTLFTKQGATMDRKILFGFNIPAASLQSFTSLSILIFIPIYDRIFVPIARAFTGKTSGITMLQRIGIGIFSSSLSMVVAALVEIKRLNTAQQFGLVDMPSAPVPMTVWWLLPQYLLIGIADVFGTIGIQEFFYSQVPIEMRSIGLALFLSVFGLGNILSSFLVSAIDKVTSPNSWFSNNLNKAHLDYFYWLLAGLCAIGFVVYLYSARSYIYNGGCI
ncbi:protein NRT1/ PTR FAMILY 5.10 [Ziziphus jujuba]|uniref:Protein NRT1/ PTR FAMILY 5.10 n=1 Tax=Ziziphus jujuba TaxID=326968 RepID=A0ABM3IMI2_ZIZJJ|nr:protein NRT1/ PTR FAMILY 5.10 [Ziziphus jujuba]